jgi:hypothetical protein
MVAHGKVEGNMIESKLSQPPPAYHHQEEDHLSLQVFWNVNGDCVIMVHMVHLKLCSSVTEVMTAKIGRTDR